VRSNHGGHRASAQRGRPVGGGGDSARGDDGQGDGVADGGNQVGQLDGLSIFGTGDRKAAD
jgi:hypothetical protein